METTLHATSHADNSPTQDAARPALQKCVVPVAPTCFLLPASAGVDIGALSAYIREIARTYHAYGAASLTFIISDAQPLQHAGFFSADNQRALVDSLPIELRYLFASEAGATYVGETGRTLPYWGEYFSKAGAR
ncbi:hypothetical protein [Janthinobacterium lividum]